MTVDQFKRRLSELDTTLSARVSNQRQAAREQLLDSTGDAGDAGLSDESESEDYTEAELDAIKLQQVRDALRRIDDGTFGRCVVDGEPIETKRLEASPWTPYCLKHARFLEAEARPRTPTL